MPPAHRDGTTRAEPGVQTGLALPAHSRSTALLFPPSPENIAIKQLHTIKLESKVMLLLGSLFLGNKSNQICFAAKKTRGYLLGLLWMMKISSLNPSPISLWTTL